MKRFVQTLLSILFIATTTFAATTFAASVHASPLSVSDNAVLAETATPYTTSGTTLTVTATNGSDITTALNEALSEAGTLASSDNIYTVKVPAGSYTISGTIHMCSNTILDLYNVTITSATGSPEFCMLTLGDATYTSSAACKGYEGFENITVKGGTFTAAATHYVAPIRLMHADNVTLKDVTVGGGIGDHLVEVAALQNFLMDGCTLQNMSDSKLTDATTREALQFDLAAHDSVYPSCYQDGTMMKNVTVQNCTFKNVSRGIGSHSQLLNAYHENIKILNNTFKDVEKECIIGLNYYNCEISGNTMTDCGAGIIFQYSKNNAATIFTTIQNGTVPYKGTTRYDAKTVIKNNTITTKYTGYMDIITGIEASGRNITKAVKNSVDGGTIPAGDYYISGVEIADNTITTAGYGVVLQDAKNCIVSGNKITCAGYNSADKIAKEKRYNGIHAGQASTKNKIAGNTISSAQSNGMYFQDGSSASEITKNTITKPGKDGITISEGCSVTGNITSNVISGSGEHGISLAGATIKGDIALNQIAEATLSGINIYTSSAVNGNVCDNTISKSKVNGINIGNSSKVTGNIARNTISETAKTGIQIISNSSVFGNIDANTVKNSTVNGISVITKATVDGDISANIISGSKKTGINVYDSSQLSGSIKGNTVSDSTVNGICVGDSSVVKGNIESNSVSASKKNGIQVIQKSTVNKKILSNTVTNSTVNGICITTSSKVKKGIESNTVKKAKKYGIYVCEKSTVNADVTGNKISSCDTPIVVTPNCSIAIRKNTISKNKNNYYRIATTSIKVKSVNAAKFSSSSGKGKKITLKWKKVKGVTGYYIELSTTADFKKVSKKIDTKSTNGVFKKLKKGKTYYVRISAYKESGKARIYSNYSKAKKIKVS